MLNRIFSLTNSLTNSASYHMHSQIPHLTVLIFAHQFAKMCLISLTNSLTNLHLLPYTLTNKSPHSSKVRSPIRKHFVNSLTNSLTNHSYHMRPQISHLTVLKFAHQFAPSKLFVRLNYVPYKYAQLKRAGQSLHNNLATSCSTTNNYSLLRAQTTFQ